MPSSSFLCNLFSTFIPLPLSSSRSSPSLYVSITCRNVREKHGILARERRNCVEGKEGREEGGEGGGGGRKERRPETREENPMKKRGIISCLPPFNLHPSHIHLSPLSLSPLSLSSLVSDQCTHNYQRFDHRLFLFVLLPSLLFISSYGSVSLPLSLSFEISKHSSPFTSIMVSTRKLYSY